MFYTPENYHSSSQTSVTLQLLSPFFWDVVPHRWIIYARNFEKELWSHLQESECSRRI